MNKEALLAGMMFGGQAGGGGGGLPTPFQEGYILKITRDLGEESSLEWNQTPIHDGGDCFVVELEFDGETWTHPEYAFSSLTSEYQTHSFLYANINGMVVVLHPTSIAGSSFNFATAVVPLDSLGLTGMVGFLQLYYDEDFLGGWGISLEYWSASTL